MNNLWVEKYRPNKIEEYVFRDEKQKKQINQWIQSGALPHILLSGPAGTGKTTLIKVLLNELNVNSFDILIVNASKDNGVDYIKETVTRFAETMGVGNMRYIFLDESDYLSVNAQAVLRNIIEKYSNSVRFLLTCNYPHKIIDAIKSRCETGRMHIEKPNQTEYYTRLIDILTQENVDIDPDALEIIVNKSYPDLRRGISIIQKNCFDGKLCSPDDDTEETSDYKIEMIALFRSGNFKEARKLICSKITNDEYEDMYTFMYRNLDVWGDTEEKQNKAILAIRDGIVKSHSVGDQEINLSATIVELELISKGLL